MAGDRRAPNEVDWANIEHAHGSAADVPELVRAVIRGGPDTAEACGALAENLNHQGSIYPATGPAVPLLIDALRATTGGPRVRAGLLSLLGGVAAGAAEWLAEEANDPAAARADDGAGDISFSDVFARVWQGSELYVSLLAGDPDADVRMQATYVLGVLASPGPTFAPDGPPVGFDGAVAALLGRVGAEDDGLALASVALALGAVIRHVPAVRGGLRELFGRAGATEAARVAAALALVEADGDRHEEGAAADLLVDTMRRAKETDLMFQPRTGTGKDDVWWCPWVWGKLRFRLCRALCAWSDGDEGRMRRVLPGLLAGVREANGYTAESDIGPILLWLWPRRDIRLEWGPDRQLKREVPPPVTAGELTGLRREVVAACYANPGIWKPPVGNTGLAFMRVGLPETRAELGELLGEQ